MNSGGCGAGGNGHNSVHHTSSIILGSMMFNINCLTYYNNKRSKVQHTPQTQENLRHKSQPGYTSSIARSVQHCWQCPLRRLSSEESLLSVSPQALGDGAAVKGSPPRKAVLGTWQNQTLARLPRGQSDSPTDDYISADGHKILTRFQYPSL